MDQATAFWCQFDKCTEIGHANHHRPNTLVGRQGIGGSKVIQHWDKADAENEAKKALVTGKVDVFTMAPHVMVPDPGITNFVELGLKHNSDMRFLLQASWYPFDVADPEKRIKDNAARDAMKIEDLQAAVDEWRTRLEAQADELNKLHGKRCVFIVPAGDAVHPRHRVVGEQQVDRAGVRVGQAQRLIAVARAQHLVAEVREDRHHQVADAVLVLGDQHGLAAAPSRRRRRRGQRVVR